MPNPKKRPAKFVKDHPPRELPLYRSHPGTIKVSGSTTPHGAASCAFKYLHEGVESVEFLYIGANAGHIAMKIMGTLLDMVEQRSGGTTTISFQPRRYRTVVLESGDDRIKDCIAWYTVIHTIDDTANDTKEEETETDGKTV